MTVANNREGAEFSDATKNLLAFVRDIVAPCRVAAR